MGDTVARWLSSLGLAEHAAAFERESIGFDVLRELTDRDLRDIGVSALGDRRRILAAIAAIAASAPPAVAAADVRPPEAARRQVAVLFADISGFTRISRTLGDEETHAMLEDFYDAVDEVIERHGGAVDKHVGDAVMGVFGAVSAHTDDTERALRAASAIHRAVEGLHRLLKVHVGVAAGQVVASMSGSARHNAYTVTGESVNLASRLTDLAGPGETLVWDGARRIVGDFFEGVHLGERLVEGLPEPVGVWRLASVRDREAVGARVFVGRTDELAAIERALQLVREGGPGGAFLIRGEPGIGKSRLVEEAARMAEARGVAVHRGGALDFGAGKGQDAARAVLRSLMGLPHGADKRLRAAAAEAAVAEGRVPEDRRAFLVDLLDLERSPAIAALYDAMDVGMREEGKRRTLADLARITSEAVPALLVFEDMHWADPAVLGQLAALFREAAEAPLVLLATTRLTGDPFDQAWHARCGEAVISAMRLGPLSDDDASRLAEGFGDVPRPLMATCVARAAGNPLLLEQLLLNAEEVGDGELPGSVRSIVQARVDALPVADRKALQAASVFGQRFTQDQLAAVAPEPASRAEALIQPGLVRHQGEGYHFAHALVREAVYASLLKASRRELHLRAAAHFRDRDADLHARHLDQAEDPRAPVAYLDAAARHHERFDEGAALAAAERALELAADPASRFEAMCLCGDLLRDLGRSGDSLAAYEDALAAASDDVGRCRAAIGSAAALRIIDRIDDALARLDEAQAAASRARLPERMSEVRFLRGNLLFPLGRLEDCRIEHEASLALAVEAGDRVAEARALGGLGDAHFVAGRMRDASEQFGACVDLARAIEHRRIEAANLPMLGWARFFELDLPAAEDAARATLAIAEVAGTARPRIIAHNLLGEIAFARGRFAEVGEHGRAGLEIARTIGARRFEAVSTMHIGRAAAFAEGDRARGRALLLDAWATSRETGKAFMGPWVLGTAALLAETETERRATFAEAERILAAGALHHNVLMFRAEAMQACRDAGDLDGLRLQADALERETREAPCRWASFHVALGRALLEAGAMPDDRRLRDLRAKAASLGLARAAAAIDRDGAFDG